MAGRYCVWCCSKVETTDKRLSPAGKLAAATRSPHEERGVARKSVILKLNPAGNTNFLLNVACKCNHDCSAITLIVYHQTNKGKMNSQNFHLRLKM